jgi:hypothetical protein
MSIHQFPKINTVYSFNEIATKLNLPDSPFLQFVYNDTRCIIQTSHISDNDLLGIPGMSESLWCYEKTTRENIPLFWYYDNDILAIVDIEKIKGSRYLATPKGFPIKN